MKRLLGSVNRFGRGMAGVAGLGAGGGLPLELLALRLMFIGTLMAVETVSLKAVTVGGGVPLGVPEIVKVSMRRLPVPAPPLSP